MTIKEKEELLYNLLRDYNSMQNELKITLEKASELLNLSLDKTTEFFNLLTNVVDNDNLEALSNMRLFIEAIKPLFGDV